ncbi:hypothetical protein ZWY2020_016408 [Hordeum vulgare]|nr:hypothetical protein ZWY2020_016408 [Hordeum vulgare]
MVPCAPELCGSFFSKYTPAIDIWSIGCIFAEVLTRNPLFPGTNVTHQLDLITDVLGTPSHETLSQICNEKARRYLTGMKRKHPIPFPRMFCNADPQAVRVLERLLAFDPKDRPTAEEALADPYFEGLPKLEHEPSPYPFSKLDFEFERWKLSKDGIRDLIYREVENHHFNILEYHPQMLQDYIRGGGQTSFVYPSLHMLRISTSEENEVLHCGGDMHLCQGIPDFCSGYYLQNGGTSDSSCAIGENEGPKNHQHSMTARERPSQSPSCATRMGVTEQPLQLSFNPG